jgi:hypothetical protein
MKEQINEADVTIEVHGFFYKIPYFVMLEDPAITEYFKVDKDFDGESMIKRYFLHPVLLKERNSLFILKAIVALKKNEYYSYRYVKLNDFDDSNHLDYLKRELSFFAGAEWRQFRKDDPFVILFDALRTFFGGIPETLTVEVPGNFWACSNHIVENMTQLYGRSEAVVVTDPPLPKEGDTVRPVAKFIFGRLTIYIKDKVL